MGNYRLFCENRIKEQREIINAMRERASKRAKPKKGEFTIVRLNQWERRKIEKAEREIFILKRLMEQYA